MKGLLPKIRHQHQIEGSTAIDEHLTSFPSGALPCRGRRFCLGSLLLNFAMGNLKRCTPKSREINFRSVFLSEARIETSEVFPGSQPEAVADALPEVRSKETFASAETESRTGVHVFTVPHETSRSGGEGRRSRCSCHFTAE
eukprot:symbB.v1.2.025091.t1/scaffold2313.1/size127079/12